ncbi:site-specific integrase [Clostridium cuniculi]|uniref:site-specific integrase n=1 Tax=Clostridium cuniculi TaxID=2548455 RepID=UPI001056CA60|nr:site-specific integrase [Clostridium cuniculi]
MIINGYRKRSIDEYKNSFNRMYSCLLKDYDEINKESISKYLKSIKNKTEVSRAVNAIRILENTESKFNCFSDLELKEIISNKSDNKAKSYEPYTLDTAKRKINTIRDKKYKLAYRLMIVSGARVFEVADLKKEDIIFNDNKTITLKIKDGKGGKSATINCLKDDYLFKELKCFLENKLDEENIFYSKIAMQKKAQKLNFKCHDLRRAYSKLVQKEIKEEVTDFLESEKDVIVKDEIKKAMRHSKFETSESYLYSKRIEV